MGFRLSGFGKGRTSQKEIQMGLIYIQAGIILLLFQVMMNIQLGI